MEDGIRLIQGDPSFGGIYMEWVPILLGWLSYEMALVETAIAYIYPYWEAEA